LSLYKTLHLRRAAVPEQAEARNCEEFQTASGSGDHENHECK
jgi:hypothetical protein